MSDNEKDELEYLKEQIVYANNLAFRAGMLTGSLMCARALLKAASEDLRAWNKAYGPNGLTSDYIKKIDEYLKDEINLDFTPASTNHKDPT